MGYAQPQLTSAQIMDEIAELTPSFHGISHKRLDSEEVAGRGLQWPCLGKDHPGTPIMHVGARDSDRRANTLNTTFGIAERTFFFRITTTRKNNIGELGCFS